MRKGDTITLCVKPYESLGMTRKDRILDRDYTVVDIYHNGAGQVMYLLERKGYIECFSEWDVIHQLI